MPDVVTQKYIKVNSVCKDHNSTQQNLIKTKSLLNPQITTSRMFPKFSFLLMFAVVLSLTHKSLCQDNKQFEKKHLINTLKVDCDNVMKKALFNCKSRNTFIYSLSGPVKALCKGVTGKKDVLSRTQFTLIDCIETAKNCQYKSKSSTNVICITCEKELPVHFVKVGSC